MHLVETGRNDIGYVDQGTGPPIVFVHSSGMGAQQWERTITAIGGQHQCLAPDLCGYGQSSAPRNENGISLEQDAEMVASIVELAGEGAHLVGHSYGGAVALIAAQSAKKLASLTLIEPVIVDLLRNSNSDEAAADLISMASLFLDTPHGPKAEVALSTFVDYWNTKGAWESLAPEARTGLLGLAGKLSMEVRSVVVTGEDVFAIHSMEAPVLILTGGETRAAPRRMSELVLDAAPNATQQIIAGAGHMSPLTHPAEVASAIVNHVAANGGLVDG